MDESEVSTEQALDRLKKIEEKLTMLKEFTEKAEEVRENRKKLIENLTGSSENTYVTNAKSETRKVKFADDRDQREMFKEKHWLQKLTSFRPSIAMSQRSMSVQGLLTNLNTLSDEVNKRKSEIQLLKIRKQSIVEPSELSGHDERIRVLERENDDLEEKLLHFVLQNVNESKEEYQFFITQLEDENKAMEDQIIFLQDNVRNLRENNRALMRENELLRKGTSDLFKKLSEEDIEGKYRKSLLVIRSSTLLTEAYLLSKSSSAQFLRDLEREDRLSLGDDSQDSFDLDEQIAGWKMDDESMLEKLNRLQNDAKDMEVTHMKLLFVKQYVRKHGTNTIHKNTNIDPYRRPSVWR